MQRRSRNQQQGVVLIVGLVLMIALTLMGIMAVKMTTMDERIASNNQFRTLTFQAAESVLAEMASGDALQTAELCENGWRCINLTYTVGENPETGETAAIPHQIEAEANIIGEEDMELPGSSIGEGGGATIKMHVYHIEASAFLNGTHAQASHRAGIGRPIPAPQ